MGLELYTVAAWNIFPIQKYKKNRNIFIYLNLILYIRYQELYVLFKEI
jgi:hypothetical protein